MSTVPAQVVEGRAAYAEAARTVVGQARLSLSLLSQDLEAESYGLPAFADAVKRLVLEHQQAQVRVLVFQARAAVRGPHALVDLGHLLTSRIEFRDLPPDLRQDFAELVIADGRVLLERRGVDDAQATLYLDSPLTARERQKRFDELWEESLPSQELRRLSI